MSAITNNLPYYQSNIPVSNIRTDKLDAAILDYTIEEFRKVAETTKGNSVYKFA